MMILLVATECLNNTNLQNIQNSTVTILPNAENEGILYHLYMMLFTIYLLKWPKAQMDS
jgi:hypothetical protein